MARKATTLLGAIVWSASWALGVALGVALGAYLTAVSGVGAPGISELDSSQLVRLPALTGGAAFVVVFVGRMLFLLVSRFARPHHADDEQGHDQDAENNEVSRAH